MEKPDSYPLFLPVTHYNVDEISAEEFIQAIVSQSHQSEEKAYLISLIDKLMHQAGQTNDDKR